MTKRSEHNSPTAAEQSLHTDPGGPIQPHIQCVPGVVSFRVRRPSHKADHSSPSNAEVKDVWSYTSNGYTKFSSKQTSETGRDSGRYSDSLWAGRSGDRIPVRARFSAPVQTSPGAHPVFYAMGTGSFPGVKSGRGVTLTTHPHLAPRLKKE